MAFLKFCYSFYSLIMTFLSRSTVIYYSKRYPSDGTNASNGKKYEERRNIHQTEPILDNLNNPDVANFLLSSSTDELNTMSTGEDESSSGVNGRLRPRKTTVVQSQRVTRKSETRNALERPKRSSTPSKVTPTKADDLQNKSDATFTVLQQCAYCDRKFSSKQNLSNHVRRVHFSPNKQEPSTSCLFCSHAETDPEDIIRHMVENHPNHYFACLDCHTRFSSTIELAEHKLNECEKQKPSYLSKSRQKTSSKTKKNQKQIIENPEGIYRTSGGGGFNGVVISCELKPSQVHDEADIEDNITTNLILPTNKALSNSVIEKNAVIILDDIQWNKRIPSNFSFHNTDADQILSRLGVVHKSPRTGVESNKKNWIKMIDEANQKFERCFDTSFYSRVASNVHENLSKFLDGTCNFNPDPENVIKTRKSKNNVVINTVEGFPILLAKEQLTRNVFETYLPRAIAPKHKWKWDTTDSDKITPISEKIKRDSHTNNCIVSLVSSLDIWTQLCMRRKFEEKFSTSPLEKKTEKQNALSLELKEILESRDIPAKNDIVAVPSTSRGVGAGSEWGGAEPPSWLGLQRAAPAAVPPPAVVSGEWARPRCYVCCACGHQTRDPRAVTAHANAAHPHALVQHYEIVGERLLQSDILKHLHVGGAPAARAPRAARARPARGLRDCTKCGAAVSLEELHAHMLECAGDVPAARRRVRPRPFGARRRRLRLPPPAARPAPAPARRQRPPARLRRARPKIRTEVGDAETIRKMIADLPAKRHRVMINPTNGNRPQRNLDKQRNKLIMKRRGTDELKNRRLRAKKEVTAQSSNESTSVAAANKLESNDDDDKPLKPPSARMSTRRMEALKRNKQTILMNRVKRKAVKSQEQDVVTDISESAEPSKDTDDSVGNSKRLDPKQGAPLGKQHGDIGQREGAGDHPQEDKNEKDDRDRDDNANNYNVPPANTSFQYSIARLTANTDTHDKAVQFNYSFRMQLNCNNIIQHGRTGQVRRFENEPVESELDKPPLTDGLLSDNKHRPNKPRKGLNACIAMLKNKLSEPNSRTTPGRVSVLCGPDDTIDEPLEYSDERNCGINAAVAPKTLESNQTATVIVDNDNRLELINENLLQIGSKNIFNGVCVEADLKQDLSMKSNDHQQFTKSSGSLNDLRDETVYDKTLYEKTSKMSSQSDINVTDAEDENEDVVPKKQLSHLAARIQTISPKFIEVVSLTDQNLETAESSQSLLATSESGIQLLEGTTPDLITKLSQRLNNFPENANNMKRFDVNREINMKNINVKQTPVQDENINSKVIYDRNKFSQQENIAENEDISAAIANKSSAQNINLIPEHHSDFSEADPRNAFLQHMDADIHMRTRRNSIQNDIIQRGSPCSTICQSEVNQSYALAYENIMKESLRKTMPENEFIHKYHPCEALLQYDMNHELSSIRSFNLNGQSNAISNETQVYHEYQAAKINQYRLNDHGADCYGRSINSQEINAAEPQCNSENQIKDVQDLQQNFTPTYYNDACPDPAHAAYPQIHPPQVGLVEMEPNLQGPLDLSIKAPGLDKRGTRDENLHNGGNSQYSKFSTESIENMRLSQHEQRDLRLATPQDAYLQLHVSQYTERPQIPEPFYPHTIAHNNYMDKELLSNDTSRQVNDIQRMQYVYGMPLSNARYHPDMPVMPNPNDVPSRNNLRSPPDLEAPYVSAEYCLPPKYKSPPASGDFSVKQDAEIIHLHGNMPLMQSDSINQIETLKNYDNLNNYAHDAQSSCDYPLSDSYRSTNMPIDHMESTRGNVTGSPNYYMDSPNDTQELAMNNKIPTLPIPLPRTPMSDHPSQGIYGALSHNLPEYSSNVTKTDNETKLNCPISGDEPTLTDETQCLVPLASVPCSAPASLQREAGFSTCERSAIPPSKQDSVIVGKPCNNVNDQHYSHANTERTAEEPKERAKPTLVQNDTEQDPETAKKIAMLPKELVEIIGTMPADHRNQLLNILPQYVSNSTPTVRSNQSESKLITPPLSTTSSEGNDISTIKDTKGTRQVEVQPQRIYTQEIHSTKCSVEGFTTSNNTLNTSGNVVDTPCVLEEATPVDQECKSSKDNSIVLIDLTEDDSLQSLVSSNLNDPSSNCTQDDKQPSPAIIKKPKSFNERTASLRAVRIKTASERNKSINTYVKSLETPEILGHTHNKEDNTTEHPARAVNTMRTNNYTEPESNELEIKTEPEQKEAPETDISVFCESSEKRKKDIAEEEKIDQTNMNKSNFEDSSLEEENSIDPYLTIDTNDKLITNDEQTTEVIGKADENNTQADKNITLADKNNTLADKNNTLADKNSTQVDENNTQSRDDEDSDDDVSLATIVQKKMEQNKECLEKNSEETVDIIPKTKKIKRKKAKLKNPIAFNEIKMKCSSETIKDEIILENNLISNENKFKIRVKTHKHSKKRSKKKRSRRKQAENDMSRCNDQEIPDIRAVENENLTTKSYLQPMIQGDNDENVLENKSIKIVENFSKRHGTKLKMSDILYRGQNTSIEKKNSYNDEIIMKHVKPDKVLSSTSLSLKIQLKNKERVPPVESNSDEPLQIVEKEINIIGEDRIDTLAPLRRSRRGKSLFVEKLVYGTDLPETTEEKSDENTELHLKQIISNDGEQTVRTSTDQQYSEHYQEPQVSQSLDARNSDLVGEVEAEDEGKELIRSTKIKTHKKSLKRKKSLSKQKQKKKRSDDHPKESPVEESNNHDMTECNEGIIIPTMNPKDHTDNISYSPTTTDNTNAEKTMTSAEKRKIAINFDSEMTPHTKSKKFKKSHDNSENSHDSKTELNTESKSTTCYSQPLAVRKIRSKSVSVKQPCKDEAYDPYDIDLDEMIVKVDKFSRHARKEQKRTKSKSTDTKGNKIECITKNDNKTDNVPPVSADEVNDSDSSKSDVPLNSYVRSRESKSAVDKTGGKSNQKALPGSSKDETQPPVTNNDDTDLQSEKFMESFGFFSERKPRKSNLIATKKISETFNMIANEREDVYSETRQKPDKKATNEPKAPPTAEPIAKPQPSTSRKKTVRRKRKLKRPTPANRNCSFCQKRFRTSENYIRHLMTLHHAAKISEIELKLKSKNVLEQPDYLIIFKRQIRRLKMFKANLLKRKKNSKLAKIKLPSVKDLIAAVHKNVKDMQIKKSLTYDEELFLDCCELLRKLPILQKLAEAHGAINNDANMEASHSNVQSVEGGGMLPAIMEGAAAEGTTLEGATPEGATRSAEQQCIQPSADVSGLQGTTAAYTQDAAIIQQTMNEDTYDPSDVDSVTARTILESDEVRALENDLISGFKEAALAKQAANAQYLLSQTTEQCMLPGSPMLGPSIPGPSMPGLSIPGPSMAGLSIPGPSRAGPSMAGLSIPGPSRAGPSMAGLPISGPSMADLSIPGPSMADLSIPGPSRADHSVPSPSRAGPSMAGISIAGPSRAGPSMAGLSIPGPSIADLSIPGPSRADLSIPGPSRAGPSMAGISIAGSSRAGPSTAGPSIPGPYMLGTLIPGPSTPGSSMAGLSMAGPSRAGPSVAGLSIPGPSIPGPYMLGQSIPGPSMSGLSIPGQSISSPFMPGPSVPGPSIPSPSMPGPSTQNNISSPVTGYVADQTDIPEREESNTLKQRKYPEIKEKMYPDILIEDIDMYEDKFDKIKRKSRSQAAAAKQAQSTIENISSRQKSHKKSEKKKVKKNKKSQQNTVMTKGALKGFDGIKAADPSPAPSASPARESSVKRRKKSSSKRKREARAAGSSSNHEGEHRAKSSSQKKLDVYEFMDNEDAELFDFRPSTLMERFKSMNNKDIAGPSKSKVSTNKVESSESGSDEDDFVYMSDDYVGSDGETENSVLSLTELQISRANADAKKISSPHKRKELVEKNAVMGKIFKNNVVRGDKKSSKSKDTTKPKANLDQLFDSLLQEPVADKVVSSQEAASSGGPNAESEPSRKFVTASTQYEPLLIETENVTSSKSPKSPSLPRSQSSPSKDSLSVIQPLPSPVAGPSSSGKKSSISPRLRAASPKRLSSPARTATPVDESPERRCEPLPAARRRPRAPRSPRASPDTARAMRRDASNDNTRASKHNATKGNKRGSKKHGRDASTDSSSDSSPDTSNDKTRVSRYDASNDNTKASRFNASNDNIRSSRHDASKGKKRASKRDTSKDNKRGIKREASKDKKRASRRDASNNSTRASKRDASNDKTKTLKHDVSNDNIRTSRHDTSNDNIHGSGYDASNDNSRTSRHDASNDNTRTSRHDASIDNTRTSRHEASSDNTRASRYDASNDNKRTSRHDASNDNTHASGYDASNDNTRTSRHDTSNDNTSISKNDASDDNTRISRPDASNDNTRTSRHDVSSENTRVSRNDASNDITGSPRHDASNDNTRVSKRDASNDNTRASRHDATDDKKLASRHDASDDKKRATKRDSSNDKKRGLKHERDSTNDKKRGSKKHGRDSSSDKKRGSKHDKGKSKRKRRHSKGKSKRKYKRTSSNERVSAGSAAEEEGAREGVARRARRKCAVGKQNVLAESWSSESEGERRRVVAARPRRRARAAPPRRGSPVAGPSSAPDGPPPAFWNNGTNEKGGKQTKRGWIVGDSHKKLVTLLANAKNKLNNQQEGKEIETETEAETETKTEKETKTETETDTETATHTTIETIIITTITIPIPEIPTTIATSTTSETTTPSAAATASETTSATTTDTTSETTTSAIASTSETTSAIASTSETTSAIASTSETTSTADTASTTTSPIATTSKTKSEKGKQKKE